MRQRAARDTFHGAQHLVLPGALTMAVIGMVLLVGCRSTEFQGEPVRIDYVGSSTVANFLRDAAPEYPGATFLIDDTAESSGGEAAFVAGLARLAGIAREPSAEVLENGAVASEIGRDAIAVIVNPRNPVTELSSAELRAIFGGEVVNWQGVGGPDLSIAPLIVGKGSATREVFRAAVLGDRDYSGCREVVPDRSIVETVATTPGAIGQISFSFLLDRESGQDGGARAGVRIIAVDGEAPHVSNFEYPIARPLYLLWRAGDAEVAAFVQWAQSSAGQRVVMRRFVGTRVVGSAQPIEPDTEYGTLIVYTETYAVNDGGIDYHPHRAYDVLTRYGDFVRHVRNHRGENDEKPSSIRLAPETYLIRPRTSDDASPEFFVTIEAGKTTKLFVEDLARRQP